MPRTIHGSPEPSLALGSTSSEAHAAPCDPACEPSCDQWWGEDEDTGVRCDVVLGELRPPNEAMTQMIREKLGRLLQDD